MLQWEAATGNFNVKLPWKSEMGIYNRNLRQEAAMENLNVATGRCYRKLPLATTGRYNRKFEVVTWSWNRKTAICTASLERYNGRVQWVVMTILRTTESATTIISSNILCHSGHTMTTQSAAIDHEAIACMGMQGIGKQLEVVGW